MNTDEPSPGNSSSLPKQDLEPAKSRGWGCLQWFVIAILLVIGFGLAVPSGPVISERARLMQNCSNVRQILITLKNYAGDHDGRYPEGKTANEAFRELFKLELLEDERAFAAASSPYEPDNNIGEAPKFDQALEPGENHWAMTRGLRDADRGNAPLVFENPAVATWPPKWNADAAGQKVPGRAWKTGKIVIGRNDGSVAGEQLESTQGTAVGLKPDKDGKTLFDLAGPHEVMNVER